jgi:hypothetical protein
MEKCINEFIVSCTLHQGMDYNWRAIEYFYLNEIPI